MAKQRKTKIQEFMNSYHYRDICYLIDHINNLDVLNSCAEELGYSIGVNVIKKGTLPMLKSVSIGKNNEYRVVTSIRRGKPLTECIIYKTR